MEPTNQRSAYGTWQSPITPELAAASSRVLKEIAISEKKLYWVERRPEERGRQVVMCLSLDNKSETVTPSGFNIRNRVHEYGGGDYTVHKGCVYFANGSDQRWYRQAHEGSPQPLTPVSTRICSWRYADAVVAPNGQWLIAVRESHGKTVDNDLVAIATNGSEVIKVLTGGYDFYAAPRLNQGGNKIAWVCWNHPQMPWEGCELWLADLTPALELKNAHQVAGGVGESISQPSFGPDGKLYFISDRSGFENIYCFYNEKVDSICPMDADCGYPSWIFRAKTYDFVDAHRMVVVVTKNGQQTLGLVKDRAYFAFELAFTDFVPNLAVLDHRVIFIAAGPDQFPALISYDIDSSQWDTLHKSTSLTLAKKYCSIPQAIEFPTQDGQIAYGFYYPPQNGDYSPLPGEKPPLIVFCHGGPTSAASTGLNLKHQFWTSRGFSILEVNYGGSVGYGRDYRERLKGQWGVVDVADCVNGARFLIETQKVDPQRLIIRGSSAGGYTALCAVVLYDVFSIGSIYYGVADLESCVKETHKFESHYLEALVGRYPDEKLLYQDRSPVNHADKVSCPLIFIQGLEDKVVLPTQAEAMIAEMRNKGLPYQYVTFEHEQHGFKQAASIKVALESELAFFNRFLGFQLD